MIKELSKSETRRRRAAINRHEWDDAWVELSGHREFFAAHVRLTAEPSHVRLLARDGSELAVVPLAEIVRVVH